MKADDQADQNSHRLRRMNWLLWLVAGIGCVFSLSSAVPLFAIGDAADSSDDRSLKLVMNDADYWSSLEREDGTLPAWFGRDGLMRVPRAFADTRFTPASISAPGALSDLIDRYYGVILPGMSNRKERSRSWDPHDDEDVYSAINEFVPSFRRSAAFVRTQHIHPFGDVSPRTTSSACSVSTTACRECYKGYLSPTPTNPDGSDIFRHDLFDPSLSFPPASNYSADSLVPECAFQDDPPGYLVCSDRTLTQVPRLPREKLSIFQLNDTAVTALLSGDFEGVDVVVMNLDGNCISAIQEGAFRGVSNLLKLTAENNQITTINWTVFSGLDSLVVLSLSNNLINLDNYGKEIPPHHSNTSTSLLPGLAYLNLGGNQLGQLNKYVFWELGDSPIEDLNLKSCNISAIHPEAFEPLKHLIHIDFFNNPLVMHNSDQGALKFSSKLLQLGLGANRLFQTIPVRLISNAAANLTTLNLSGNLFFFLTSNLFPANLMPSLGTLILESCSVSLVEAGAFQNLPNLMALYLGKNQLNGIATNALPPSLTLLSVNRNPQRSSTHFSLTDDNLAHLKQLLWLDMNYMDLDEMTADVLNGLSALLVLQIRGSGLINIPGGLFSSLSNLIALDLGENTAVQTLPNDFSTGLVQTRMLFLDHCNLDFSTNGEENVTVQTDELEPYQPFRDMKDLELLYLHYNKIRNFSPNLVANLTNLRVLFLRGNLLQTWESGTTAYMFSRYSAIDVSNNRLTILPNKTFEEFDHIEAIDFSDNALTCNCEAYDLKRLASDESNTIVCFWDKPLAYTCTDTVKKEAPVIKEIPNMSEDEFHCQVSGVLGLAIGAILGLAVLLLVSAGVCYYKRVAIYRRWFVYWHGRGAIERTDTKRRKVRDENGNQFEYDAFISFNENDRPWVYTQLVPNLERNKSASVLPDNTPSFRLCLHDRDFTAGQRITENIVDNIAKSRKVVIVLSRSYVESKWCQFELHLSQHRLLESERRDDLILIVLEDVPKQQLDVGLRYIMRTRTYLAWRSEPDGQRTFWKRLRQDLMDGYGQTLDSTLSSETPS